MNSFEKYILEIAPKHMKLLEKNILMELEWFFEQFPRLVAEEYTPFEMEDELREMNLILDCYLKVLKINNFRKL